MSFGHINDKESVKCPAQPKTKRIKIMARAGAKRSTRKLKIGRSLGVNLWGQAKSPFNKRKDKPGQHGPTSRGGNSSDYAKQMRAKQTLKGYYGNIGEKKFRAYYLEAENIIGYYNNNRVPLLGIFIIFLQSNSGIITILSIVYCLLMFDYYRNKYDESIIDRIDYLKSIINFDLYDENKLKEELKVIYEEHIYFDNKDYLFNNSQYVSFKELTNDIKINVNEETFINEEKDEKDTFFNEIKKLFKKERKE